jgi:hypothetical protein
MSPIGNAGTCSAGRSWGATGRPTDCAVMCRTIHRHTRVQRGDRQAHSQKDMEGRGRENKRGEINTEVAVSWVWGCAHKQWKGLVASVWVVKPTVHYNPPPHHRCPWGQYHLQPWTRTHAGHCHIERRVQALGPELHQQGWQHQKGHRAQHCQQAAWVTLESNMSPAQLTCTSPV